MYRTPRLTGRPESPQWICRWPVVPDLGPCLQPGLPGPQPASVGSVTRRGLYCPKRSDVKFLYISYSTHQILLPFNKILFVSCVLWCATAVCALSSDSLSAGSPMPCWVWVTKPELIGVYRTTVLIDISTFSQYLSVLVMCSAGLSATINSSTQTVFWLSTTGCDQGSRTEDETSDLQCNGQVLCHLSYLRLHF